MKKKTITLTIAALLGLAGVLYAANHSFFSGVQDPTFHAGPIAQKEESARIHSPRI